MLSRKRLEYKPIVPDVLRNLAQVHFKEGSGVASDSHLRPFFPKTFDNHPFLLQKGAPKKRGPLKIAALFSGGQASGGHNVLAGIFYALKTFDPHSQFFGFLNGPSGVIENQKKELIEKEVAAYLNQGGFDFIGTGRTKIETNEQLASSLATCQKNNLDGLIIIGGDDSNTNAAVLAEYFLTNGCETRVIGVPKTIDGDLRSMDIELSFGFDSACKTYSEIIGNIARDAISARKYYHFIKLMGRSASHIALECALQTHPNLTLIGEERRSLDTIVQEIADLICKRYELGKEYGVILLPEGLIEFIPEIAVLINSLNGLLAQGKGIEQLATGEKQLFLQLPEKIQKQLLLERDPHGNVQVSQIDTQILLMDLVKQELKKRAFKGKFSAQDHFLGYEGRSCFPTNFDANYCYALGLLAALAVREELTGVICSIQQLHKSPREWQLKAIPIVQLMHLEMRKGQQKPVIRKALVDIKGPLFNQFAKVRSSWKLEDHYRYPGPIQFFGDPELTDAIPLTIHPYTSF